VNVVGGGSPPWNSTCTTRFSNLSNRKTDTRVLLKPVSQGFSMSYGNGKKFNMSGYYQAQGPGLPFNKKRIFAAVLDSVVVFKLKN
jgi:hypothetical protein